MFRECVQKGEESALLNEQRFHDRWTFPNRLLKGTGLRMEDMLWHYLDAHYHPRPVRRVKVVPAAPSLSGNVAIILNNFIVLSNHYSTGLQSICKAQQALKKSRYFKNIWWQNLNSTDMKLHIIIFPTWPECSEMLNMWWLLPQSEVLCNVSYTHMHIF